jgi:hypothetical protein
MVLKSEEMCLSISSPSASPILANAEKINWFHSKGEFSSGAVEGLDNKTRAVTRRSFGFHAFKAMEMALYHTLGRLPEPETAHGFR